MNQHQGHHTVHNGLRRSCADLGMCQACTPHCEECDEQADTCPYCDPMTAFERCVMAFVVIISIVIVVGGMGYLYGAATR